jgi:EpsI family protein
LFGNVFFVVMMLALFWIGRRWHDAMPSEEDVASGRPQVEISPLATWWPLPLACLIVLAGPPFLATSIARAAEHLADRDGLAALPPPAAGWQGPLVATGRWRPFYRGGLIERQAVYQTPDGQSVDVFVAVYGLGTTVGAEMISYNNVIFPDEHGSLAEDAVHTLTLRDGTSLKVREVIAGNGSDRKLVWHWFVVGERAVLNPFATKALEALAFVTRSADAERIVAINTPLDDSAAVRLEAFVQAHGRCVALGFPVEACGG